MYTITYAVDNEAENRTSVDSFSTLEKAEEYLLEAGFAKERDYYVKTIPFDEKGFISHIVARIVT